MRQDRPTEPPPPPWFVLQAHREEDSWWMQSVARWDVASCGRASHRGVLLETILYNTKDLDDELVRQWVTLGERILTRVQSKLNVLPTCTHYFRCHRHWRAWAEIRQGRVAGAPGSVQQCRNVRLNKQGVCWRAEPALLCTSHSLRQQRSAGGGGGPRRARRST